MVDDKLGNNVLTPRDQYFPIGECRSTCSWQELIIMTALYCPIHLAIVVKSSLEAKPYFMASVKIDHLKYLLLVRF